VAVPRRGGGRDPLRGGWDLRWWSGRVTLPLGRGVAVGTCDVWVNIYIYITKKKHT
jgi:hypothetical protein